VSGGVQRGFAWIIDAARKADAAMTAAATANLKEDEIVGLYRTITEILRKRQA
jgi:hypothetical protein